MIRPEPICNGSQCDMRKTCKHAQVPVWIRGKINSVKPGKSCGYYEEITGPSIADLVESGALPPPTRQAGR